MTHLRHFWALVLAGLIFSLPASGQTPEQLAQLDPSDLYFQGWMLARDADNLIEKEKHLDAYAKLKKAKVMFDTVAVNHATYKPDLVKGRQESTRETMASIYDKAVAEEAEKNKNSGGLLEGTGPGTRLVIPMDAGADASRMKDLQSLQSEINQLKRQLSDSINDRDANAARLRKSLNELEAERNRMASAPLRSELEALNTEIAGLRRERDAMSLALSKTRTEQKKTLEKLKVAQLAITEYQKKERELRAVIEEQRRVNGRVAKGQQEQIDELRREGKQRDRLLADANSRVEELTLSLKQSQAMVAELQEERDDLIKEKEQMATLLKMSAADGVQELLSQNLTLSKELNEAKRRVEAATENANANNDDVILAKRGLVIAKAKIQEARQQNVQHEMRIRDLETRLKQAQDDILARAESGNLSDADQEEMFVLRDIVKKQRDQLQAQQKKGQLLVEQAKRMGSEDPNWAQAVAQFTGSMAPVLSDEEKAIIDEVKADYTATSQFQPSATERRQAADDLRRRKEDLQRVAGRLFAKEDIEAARGLLGMIIEEDPGAWDAMLNLGIVNLRLDDPAGAIKQFQQAILYAGDRQIPLAHFMLGDAFYRTNLYDDAERELNLSLSLDPSNAQAKVLLGNMAGRLGRPAEAKALFQEAIETDPNIWEPHFNLAYLASRAGNMQDAKIHYQEALRRGAPARADFERTIGLNQ
ncbi:MAG: tetratricopeptide repeat protein [Verrucomicrobiaceae bacterium]